MVVGGDGGESERSLLCAVSWRGGGKACKLFTRDDTPDGLLTYVEYSRRRNES